MVLGYLLWSRNRGGNFFNRFFMEIDMLSNSDYCKSNGMFQTPAVNQVDNNHQRDTLARCCSVLCDEINRLIDENACLSADNKRLMDELEALNNALEDDGK